MTKPGTASTASDEETPHALARTGPATLHEARSTLKQLINAAIEGHPTPLTRGPHHALLTTPAHATELGWDLTEALTHSFADTRKKLGDLIQHGAEGHPQVLCRHRTPVAVLLPADADGTPTPPAPQAEPAPDTAAPDSTPPAKGQQAVQKTTAAEAARDFAPALPTTPAEAAAALTTPSEPQPEPVPAAQDTSTPAHTPPASPGTTPTTPTGSPAATTPTPATPTPGTPTLQHPATPSTALPVPPSAPPQSGPPAPTPVTPDAGHETTIPASAPPAITAPRTPRRLAALAQALDTVLPTTVPTGETTTPTPLMGLPTGLRTLDDALGGLQPGRFYLVAAAPGAGSSLIATAAARTSALDQHQPVLYAASGLTRADIAARIVAAHLPVDYRRLRASRLTPTEQDDTAALHHHLAQAPLYIDDGTDLTTGAIAESVPDLPGLALVVVDRLQTTEDPRLPLSGPTQITDAAQALAHLARTHELPVLAAVDTDDPQLIAALSLDITITLTRDADQIHATITERDLGAQATLTLHADLAHARITDPATPAPQAPPQPPAVTPHTPAQPPQAHPQAPTPTEPAPTVHTAAPRRPSRHRTSAPPLAPPQGGYASRDYSYFTGMITRAVDEALHDHDGDITTATEALVKKAVPNAMALFEATRVGGNYEHTVYPETLEFLRKKTKDGADEIWEGRHNWTNTRLMDALQNGTHHPITVNALDTNASFLSAFKTHLPIGALIHDPYGGFDPKRSGIYRLPTRPTWHHPHLPDPIGNRREDGPVLLDDATIRLLIRCARLGLCEAPHITECWTSGTSEGLLEKFRRVLTEARANAIEADDTVTVEYIKSMYSKFTSTIGESSVNRDIRRPDWMHIIRSQAFANLWYKSHRVHSNGLTVVRARGTDELHVAGDWRTVFTEGRLTTQMKQKDQYPLPRKSAR
ncbi:Replicative DNA helicase [Streptomyces sp. S4.7]|uniref:DnaB-like helicase C-terminal domain-containing protein n=1 Tax=Streptomyces sp. S4.7 TaxID=2705439 RepID=UPI001398A99E|nr:DnaB-like helicase C-terminal domain-containing protein [Streptomyces sp. S4.7]QHY93519.1 Replicative DNA helicase [Streptomyces sp. S4.7]QHZ00329.1 Replicative DNA helicase [Streptomyces sp. S4.7]